MLKIVFLIRRIVADAVIAVGVVVRLVDRYIEGNPLAEMPEYDGGVVGKFVGNTFIAPAAFAADIIRQVIVHERYIGDDAVSLAFVKDAVVES